MFSRTRIAIGAVLVSLQLGSFVPAANASPFHAESLQLLQRYCVDCHSGSEAEAGIDFETLLADRAVVERYRDWQTAARMLAEERMPPADAEQPDARERSLLASGIQAALRRAARQLKGDPGQVVMRRLTDAELGYTLQDLTGLELALPDVASDAVGGEGFTNVGVVQFVHDATLERYLETAKIVASHAILGAGPIRFYQDRGKTGLELSAINRIQLIYRGHGFRTAAGEGGEPFGLDLYPRGFYVAWQFRHRVALGAADASIAELADEEGISPRFADHIWRVLAGPSPSFPISEIVEHWNRLPVPASIDAVPTDDVRGECERIYDRLRSWQVRLAGGDDEEVARVLTADSLRIGAAQALRSRILWPDGERVAEVDISVESIDAESAEFAGVVWQDPQIRFRNLERRWEAFQPLADALSDHDKSLLGFGEHPADGQVGIADFVIQAGTTRSLRIVLPADALDAELTVEARIDRSATSGRVVRCDISAGLLGARGKTVSTLLADLESAGYRKWREGAAALADQLPQVSQREPAPSDRDPIPPPFDNTYNMPERNDFHYKVKYYRDDRFLMESILDEPLRRELDAAWSDLLTSFEYHDVVLRFIVKKFELPLEEPRIETLDSDWVDALPAEPRRHLQRLHAEYVDVRERSRLGRQRHLRDVLEIAERAWRRPLAEDEAQRLRDFYDRARSDLGLDHDAAIRTLLVRILVAPAFLYRAERPNSDAPVMLSDWEVASRLSYFLWSSLPDAELRRAAACGELRQPEKLAEQARRMLQDPEARRLSAEFFGQWFGFYQFDQYRGVDGGRFPEFTDQVKRAMYDEAISFFEHIIRRDRPVSEILFADYAFLNRELADFYGIETELDSSRLTRLEDVRSFHRGGLFGLGAVLTVTSAPLRTSPVKRGDWVLRRVVGTPVPPPPADAGSIAADDVSAEGLTMRERLEAHRRNPSCLTCHSRIDPLGFSLEQYDAIGRWRQTYRGGQPIETAGILSDGNEIAGPDGLRDYLQRNQELFHRTLCRKLLGYSLGRRESLADIFLIDRLVAGLDEEARFSSLAEKIVTSDQFRYHQGTGRMAGGDTPGSIPTTNPTP